MPAPLILRVKNSADEIPAATAAASRWLAEQGAPPAADYFTSLVIEELVTNCTKYGYDDANEHRLQIELNYTPAELMITVTDDGHRFNPLELPEPNVNLPVEERSVGGLGIHLLRKMSTRIEYAWENSHNRLTLHKKLGS